MFVQAWVHVLHRQGHRRRRCQEIEVEVEEEETKVAVVCLLCVGAPCCSWDDDEAQLA